MAEELIITVQNNRDVIARRSPGDEEVSGKVKVDPLLLETIKQFDELLKRGRLDRRNYFEVLGRLLFDMLFDGEVKTLFEAALADTPGDERLRLKLNLKPAPAHLAELPWEYLYYESAGDFLATMIKLVLSRYIARGGEPEPKDEPLTVLLVISEPKGLNPVAAANFLREMDEWSEEFGMNIHILDVPTADNLSASLARHRPHILHFIGHGRVNLAEKRSEIAMFNDEEGAKWWCPDKQFGRSFLKGSSVRVAFLHLCEGSVSDEGYPVSFAGMAEPLLLEGLQAVLAMQFPVPDADAVRFCSRFYRDLAKGRRLDQAVYAGRTHLIRSANIFDRRDFATPLFYMVSADAIVCPREEREEKGSGVPAGQASARTRGAAAGPAESTGASEAAPDEPRPITAHTLVEIGLEQSQATTPPLSQEQEEIMGTLYGQLLTSKGTPDEMKEVLVGALKRTDSQLKSIIFKMISALES